MKNTLFRTLCIIFLCVPLSITAQKDIQKRIDATGLKGVFIDTDAVFKIDIDTQKSNEIIIESGIEGETFETVTLETEVSNKLLVITSGRAFDFEAIDDKLAAHKVMSITLKITMPPHLEFWVDSTLASVWANGDYKYINFNLSSGNCKLTNFSASGIINTESGNITAQIKDTQVEANTRNGKQIIENNDSGSYSLRLRSIDGNIVVMQ